VTFIRGGGGGKGEERLVGPKIIAMNLTIVNEFGMGFLIMWTLFEGNFIPWPIEVRGVSEVNYDTISYQKMS